MNYPKKMALAHFFNMLLTFGLLTVKCSLRKYIRGKVPSWVKEKKRRGGNNGYLTLFLFHFMLV